jgi:proteasome lid subunit RPN8/RPN11
MCGVLRIDGSILDAIVDHARRDHPDEACGVVAGPAGSDTPTRLIPMENAERSSTFYRFDSMEQLRVWREMDDRDEEPVVIYHSHTATEAYPSRTDVSLAGEPGAHYLLVSTRDPETPEIRSFRIVDGAVTEEPVEVVDPGVDPHAVQSYMFGQSPTSVDYECSDGPRSAAARAS